MIDFYEPEEITRPRARDVRGNVARRLADQPWGDRRPRRADVQDAALFIVAAFSGLRLGELLALRWRDVGCGDAKLLVQASSSAGRFK